MTKSRWKANLAGCAALSVLAIASSAAAQQRTFNIPAEPAVDSIPEFARQAGIQITAPDDQLTGIVTPAISGQQDVQQALKSLLAGTGLHVISNSGSIITLHRVSDDAATAPPTAVAELVVTAQKRTEKLLNVPMSVSVLGNAQLGALHINSLADLSSFVPGLAVMDAGSPGFRTLVIRGINTSYNDQSVPATVGTYVDDLPIGSSTAGGRGANYGIDLNPYDVQQVEVLKGPQGTLYGANTLGGLVKYDLKKPDLNNFGGEIGGSVESTAGSVSPSATERGAVNIPLIPGQLGLSVSAYNQYLDGFINNVQTKAKAVNHSDEYGEHVSLLWQPTDKISVQATYLGQDVYTASMAGTSLNKNTLQPIYGANKEKSYFAEPFAQRLRDFSLSAKYDLGFASLSSSSGWSTLKGYEEIDLTPVFGRFTPGNPNALAPTFINDFVNKFVEEVRLASAEGQPLQWMIGGYYTKETSEELEYVPTLTPNYTPLPAADTLLDRLANTSYQEEAVFANATYKLTSRLDLTGGLRYSSYEQSGCVPVSRGVFGVGLKPCSSLPGTGVVQWMGDLDYHLAADALVYARFATGYRPGSGCPTCGNPTFGEPGIVKPDSTDNYEIGYKAELLDRRLQVQLDAFYIDWTNIQINLLTTCVGLPSATCVKGLNYAGNGAGATSEGVELSATYRVLPGLTISGDFDYTDAHLTQNAPGAGGVSGDPLPDTAKWSGSLIADYVRPMDGGWNLLAGADYHYRDWVYNQFAHSSEPLPSPPQNVVDIYTGARLGQLEARLYVKNLFNDRSYSGIVYITDAAAPRYVPIRPTTIGLSLDYKFR